MALSKCPSCGQSVLDVATRCPRCGFDFAEERRRLAVEEEARPLTRRRWVRPLLSALLLGGAAVVLVLGITGRLPGGTSDNPPLSMPIPPLPRDTAPVVSSAPAPVPRPAAPAPARADTARRVAGQARWTTDWANVRAGRSLEDSVVGVIPPGRRIDVGDRQNGWWSVYSEGRVIGYVAGALLGTSPPADSIGMMVPPIP